MGFPQAVAHFKGSRLRFEELLCRASAYWTLNR